MIRTPMPLGRQVLALIGKELLVEASLRTRIKALLPFGLLVLMLFSFAVGPQPHLLRQLAPGFLWLAVLLASVLSLAEGMAIERQDAAMDGVRLLAARPSALFLAKAISNTAFVLGLCVVMVPVAIALFDGSITLPLWQLMLSMTLGAGAISAPGTLFATLASEARAKDILLPLLMFPLLIPGLLAAVRATALVMLGDPMGELWLWLQLLAVFNGLYWFLCTLLFERVVEA